MTNLHRAILIFILAGGSLLVGLAALLRYSPPQAAVRAKAPRTLLKSVDFLPSKTNENEAYLIVISSQEHLPIPGAEVTCKLEEEAGPEKGGASPRSVTDSEGKTSLPKSGVGLLLIRAKGYVGMIGQVNFCPGRATVALNPSGSAEIDFVDEAGHPVPNIELKLVPPSPEYEPVQSPSRNRLHESADLLWQAVPKEKKSGADGKIIWPYLAPGDGYHWIVESSHVVDTGDIAGERGEEVEATETGFHIHSNRTISAPGHSGTFGVEPGRAFRQSVKVLRGCSISGTVANLSAGVAVKVFQMTQYQSPKGIFRSIDCEKGGLTGGGGAFSFQGIRPGKKRLTAYWKEAASFHFALMQFDLLPGEEKNVGLLDCLNGLTVPGVVELIGAEFLPPQLSSKKLHAIVNFTNSAPRGERETDSITEMIEVTIGEPFFLTGMFAGDLHVNAQIYNRPPEWADVAFDREAAIQVPVPLAVPLKIPLHVTSMAPLQVTVGYPSGQRKTPVNVCLVPISGGKIVELARVSPSDDSLASDFVTEARAPFGEYLCWGYSDSTENATNYFGETRVRILSGPNSVRINLGPGAVIRGKALDVNGNPIASPLVFKVSPFTGWDDPSTFSCDSDASGNFVLLGVPPNRHFQNPVFLGDVSSGGLGSETQVEIRRKP